MGLVKTLKDFTAQELKMMPRSARPIGVDPMPNHKIADKYRERCFREGKTLRDKRNAK